MPNLKDGILIKKGKVLAKIEKEDYEIALKKAIADIKSNQSKLAVQKHEIKDNKTILETLENKLRLAVADYNRQKQLFQKKVVSAQYFENSEEALNEQKQIYLKMRRDIAMSELELNSIKANIERAEAEQVQAELNIKRCDIKSPIDGRLENVTIEKDEYVTKGEKLFCIADDSALSIPVSLDIKDASAIMDVVSKKNNGYKHWFHYDKNTLVVIRWAEIPDKCVWEGEISRIEKFDPGTRTVTVVVKPVKFIGKDNAILPLVAGMHCKVEFIGRELKNVARIPWSALQLNGNVYVVDKNNIVHERKVNVLSSREDNIIVSSGLNEGEKIVTQRIPYGVVNGTKVKTETVK
jgi:RND family efflux transporter MFP subunit